MFPGKSAQVELQELVRAGLTPYQALSAATQTPGAFMQARTRTGPVGTITTGSRADLILLRGNPLTDIAHAGGIEGILARGRWFSKDDIHELRVKAAASQGR